MGMPSVLVLWGKDRSRIFEHLGEGETTPEVLAAFLKEYPDSDPLVNSYEFETEAECLAFMSGASEATGWEEHYVISNDDELGLIRKLIEAYCKEHPDAGPTYQGRIPDTVMSLEKEAWDFEEGELDGIAHHLGVLRATSFSNAGTGTQVQRLKAYGYSLADVKKMLGT